MEQDGRSGSDATRLADGEAGRLGYQAQCASVEGRLRHAEVHEGILHVVELPVVAVARPFQGEISASRPDRSREHLPVVEECVMKSEMFSDLDSG